MHSLSFFCRNRPEDVHLKLAGKRGGVNPFVQGPESDGEGAELFDQRYEMRQIPAEAIEAPRHEDIKPTATCIV